MKRRLLLGGLALAGLAGPALALPGDSVYQLDATLTDQLGHEESSRRKAALYGGSDDPSRRPGTEAFAKLGATGSRRL